MRAYMSALDSEQNSWIIDELKSEESTRFNNIKTV